MNGTTPGHEYTQALAFKVSSYFFGFGAFLGLGSTTLLICHVLPWATASWIIWIAGASILLAFAIMGLLGGKIIPLERSVPAAETEVITRFSAELEDPAFVDRMRASLSPDQL